MMTAISFFRKNRWVVELAILLTFVVAMCNCAPRTAQAYTFTGVSYLSVTDTLSFPDTFAPPPTIFDFASTSQFVVTPDSISEHHRDVRVYASGNMVVITTSDERTSAPIFWIEQWLFLNDSTILGGGSGTRCEWQRRNGEEAVVVWATPSLTFHAYEFWRDSSLIR